MRFLQRIIYPKLRDHLETRDITLILGPRQAGKTTMMKKLQEELESLNKPTAFFNLDIIEDRQFFKTQHTLVSVIQRRVGKKKAFIFIDEISRLNNAGLFLKGLYDLDTGYKFIVSGSGSLELKADVIEPLTGRKRLFYCLPLSFPEFAAYKLGIKFEHADTLYSEITKDTQMQPYMRRRLVEEYLRFGGYPKVVLSENENEKTEVLREAFTSYLEKDIGLLLKVKKEQAFENLVKVLAHQVGNLINRAELSSTLGVTEKTINNYLYLLEKTFVIYLVKPFYRNARKELTKAPKVYFSDLGFLHMAQGVLPSSRVLTGNVFENACLLRLKELSLLKHPNYWRTQSGAEVDFVVFSPTTGKPIPIEVKYRSKGTFGKSLISFMKNYHPDKGFIYSLDNKIEARKFQAGNTETEVALIPYHILPFRVRP